MTAYALRKHKRAVSNAIPQISAGRTTMPVTMPLSEAIIRRSASVDAYQKGRNYYQQGGVFSLIKRGNVLQAEVKGSHEPSSRVKCTVNERDLIITRCTCSYKEGGWCEHVVAT